MIQYKGESSLKTKEARASLELFVKRRVAACQMASTPSPALVAALKGEFGKSYDGRKLRPATQQALVDLFAGRGESLVDVIQHVVVTRDNEAGWRAYWNAVWAHADMVTKVDAIDLEQFVLWALARCEGGSTALALGNSQAKKALDILDTNGIALPNSVRTDIEAAMNSADAGDEKKQCCSAEVVWLLYYVRNPEPDEVSWYNHQFNTGGGREGGKVEITKCPSYIKFHAKSSDTSLSLERVLKRPAEDGFTEWTMKVLDGINNAGKIKASAMFMRMLSKAHRFAQGSWLRKRAYLYGYFFEEFTGLGLPADFSVQAAMNANNVQLNAKAEEESRLKWGGASSGSIYGGSFGGGFGGSSVSEYSRLPGSVSESGGGFDLKELAAVIQSSVEAGLAKGGGGGDSSGTSREGATCMYCRRSGCAMLAGGKPCREANRAASLLREKLNSERDAQKKASSSTE